MTYEYAVRRDGVLLIRKLTRKGAQAVADKYLGAVVTRECALDNEG